MRKRLTMVGTCERPPAAPVLGKKELDGMRMGVTGRREVRVSDRERLRAARIVLSPGELARLLEQLLEGDARAQLEADAAAESDREIAALRAELDALRAGLRGTVTVLDDGDPFPPTRPGLARRGGPTKKSNAA
jgi:hypothetical protein